MKLLAILEHDQATLDHLMNLEECELVLEVPDYYAEDRFDLDDYVDECPLCGGSSCVDDGEIYCLSCKLTLELSEKDPKRNSMKKLITLWNKREGKFSN